jgi:hypothetical protein
MKNGVMVWHSTKAYVNKASAIKLADKNASQNVQGLVYEVISDEKFKEIQKNNED